jgi:hypothetical protein
MLTVPVIANPDVLVAALKALMSFVPLGARPIRGCVFVHVNDAPAGVLVNSGFNSSPGQAVMFEIGLITGWVLR